MNRILFEKTGNAVWISHLDLMRLFQRAFKRAGLPLTHTRGFTPRPSVSIALPMSVGVESVCELLDFDLECEMPEPEEMVHRLNAVLIDGLKVRQAYADGRKIRDLAYLGCDLSCVYDSGVTARTEEAIRELLGRNEVCVTKKNKNGTTEQNIVPMIRSCTFEITDDRTLTLHCVVCCQNPTLNPAQIVAAIEKYIPAYKPDFYRCKRLEIYDHNQEIFR